MNVIDRQLVTPGGGFLVTDFDDGGSARNSLNSATVRMTHYDAGFTDSLPSSSVLLAGSGQSTAAFGDLPTAADYFPGLPAQFIEGTTASGDSGGPLFILDPLSRTWQLAGLASWGFNPLLAEGFARTDSRYGDLAFFTDLTANRDWIMATTIPEPSVPLFMAFTAMLAATRRRRQLASE